MLVRGCVPIFAADWYTDWYTKFNRYTNTGNYTMSEKTFDLSTVKGVQKIHHDGMVCVHMGCCQ